MTNNSGHFIFAPGKYFIGDPCYAIKDENWSKVCDETGVFGCDLKPDNSKFDGLFEYNGKECFAFGTKYGDGSYLDNRNHVYGVDAGLIGLLPLSVCDGDSMDCGEIVEFHNSFNVNCADGVFYFGSIEIDTANDDNEDLSIPEDEYYEYYEDEEEYSESDECEEE